MCSCKIGENQGEREKRVVEGIFPLYCEDPSDTLIEWKIRQLLDILVIVSWHCVARRGATSPGNIPTPVNNVYVQSAPRYQQLAKCN